MLMSLSRLSVLCFPVDFLADTFCLDELLVFMYDCLTIDLSTT